MINVRDLIMDGLLPSRATGGARLKGCEADLTRVFMVAYGQVGALNVWGLQVTASDLGDDQ